MTGTSLLRPGDVAAREQRGDATCQRVPGMARRRQVFEHVARRRRVGVGEEADDRDEQVVEEGLVGAGELQRVVERDDQPLGLELLSRGGAAGPAPSDRAGPVDGAIASLLSARLRRRMSATTLVELRPADRSTSGRVELLEARELRRSWRWTTMAHTSRPCGWTRTGEHMLVNTAVGRVKERAMHEGASVALSVSPLDDPYEHVDIRGRVVRGSRATRRSTTSTSWRASTAGPTALLAQAGRAAREGVDRAHGGP